MAYSEAQKRASMKYAAKTYERMNLQLKKGKREIYKQQAEKHGMSLNAYVVGLLEREIEREGTET